MRSSRDTVNGVEIASPCSMAWDEMEGDARVRFCPGCRLHVYNLSAMDVEEAARLISESTDRLCVRLYRRRDGTVLTQDCPVGLRAVLRRRAVAFVSSVAAGVGVLTGFLLRPQPRGAVAPPVPEVTPLMGDVAVPLPAVQPDSSEI